MARKVVNYYKETVTKDKLLHYLSCYGFIEIIPLKDDEPIFILKNLPYRPTLSEKYPRNLVIHKESFILSTKRIDIGGDFRSKGQIILSPTDTDTTYLDRYKKVDQPKTFSTHSIFDKQIRVSDKRYIKPIRDLFRKYSILEETRGKIKSKSKIAKERYDFVVKELKKIIKQKKKTTPVQDIHNKWMDKVMASGEDEKSFCSYTTIRRDIERYKKVAFRH